MYGSLKGTESGAWHFGFSVAIYHPTKPKVKLGDRDFGFNIRIGEKPDNRVKPEVYFEPNGATIEGDGDEIRYVYQYDGEGHAPLMYLRYDDKEIDITEKARKARGYSFEDGYYGGRLPTNKGIYEVKYNFSGDDFVNKNDVEKYKGTTVIITVEIKE